jgi:glycerate 2-kinase
MADRRDPEPRAVLRRLFDAAIHAVDPAKVVPLHLPTPPKGRTHVVGAGKAAAAMAKALEDHWPAALGGMVITRYGYAAPCRRIEVVEAGHPVPDVAGRAAAQRLLDSVKGLGPNDLLICLISGGASALLALPAPGITLADKQAVTRALLKSGANIGEINCVRKHLSAIKGGRLATMAAPAAIVTLAISDVPGNYPAVIGSGPTVPDPSTFAEARAILEKYAIEPPSNVESRFAEAIDETPKPGDPHFGRSKYVMIAAPHFALEAAAAEARGAGITPVVLSDAVQGEAREVALVHAAVARQITAGRFVVGDRAVMPPAVLLSGGETTVTIRGKGRGGRNTEFLLALALALNGQPGISALACDTDGIDGTEDNAGAIYLPDSNVRAEACGLDLAKRLADNDGWGVFSALGDLVVTGPTLTNVTDFRAILCTNVISPGR